MALKVGELYASFGIDSSGIGSAISGIEKKCSGIASSLTKTGAIFSASVTAPIVAFGKEIYTAGTAFYGQMSRVEAISGATADEIKALTAKAIEMGSTTSFTASQAGQALEYMAMAGWDTEAMLAGLTPIMDLAAASGEDLGTVSDIVTDALTAFGLTAEDAAHFSDVLAATATSANTNVGMMGYTFQQVGPLAGALGYKIDDMAVAIGIMANAGIKGEKAGTQLRAIISNLADPTTEMADAMRELGLSLTDSSGQVLPFNELLGNLRTSFAGLSEEERAMYAATIAGKEGMAGLLALINASDEDIAELTKAIQECEGATGEMASTILDNAAGDVTIFKSAIEGLQITLWGLVEDSFRDVVQGATKVVDSFRTMDSQTQTTILKVAGLAAAAGPAMIGLGGIVWAVGKLLPLMGALISPIGIVTAGVALFGVAAVDAGNDIGKGFVKLSKSMKKSLSDINKNLSNQIKTVSKRIPALASSISEGLGEIMPVGMESAMTIITGFVSTIADNASDLAGIGLTIVTNIVDGVAAGLPKLIPAGAQMVTNIATSLISNLPNLLSALGGLAMSIWDSLHAVNWSELGGQIWNAITSAFKQTGDWVKQVVLGEKYTPEAGWGAVGAAIWESIKSGIKATGDWVKQLVLGKTYTTEAGWDVVGSAIWTSIKSGIKETGDWLAALIMPEGTTFEAGTGWSAIGKSIWEAIKGGISVTGDWLAGLIMPSNTTFEAGSGWETIGKSIWAKIQTGITATGDWIKGLILGNAFTADSDWTDVGEKIVSMISSGLSKLDFSAETMAANLTSLGNFVQTFVKNMLEKKVEFGTSVTEFVTNLVSEISTFDGWAGLAPTFGTIATSLIDGIVSAIPTVANGASDIIASIGNLFVGIQWTDFIDPAKQIGTTIINGMVKGISVSLEGAKQIVDSIAHLLKEVSWKDAGSAAGDIAATLVNGLIEGMKTITPDLTELTNAIKRGLETAGNGIGTAAGSFVGKFIEALFSEENWTKLVKSGGLIVEGILAGIVDLGTGILKGAYNLIASFCEGILVELDIMDDADTRLGQAMHKLANLDTFDAEGNIFANQGRMWLSEAIKAWDYVAQYGSDELIAQYQEFSWLANEQVVSAFNTLTATTGSATEKAAAAIALQDLGLGDLIDNAMAGMDESMANGIHQMVEYLTSGEGAALLQSTLESLGLQIPQAVKDGIAQGMTIAEAFAAASGTNTAESYAEGQTSGEEAVETAAGNLVEVAEGKYSELPDLTSIFGEDSSTGLGTGIKNGKTAVTDAMAEVSNAAVEEFLKEMSYDTGYELGQEYTKGIQKGVSSQQSFITAASAAVASAAKNMASNIMSMAVGTGIGYNFSSGIAQGIRNGIGLITSAASAAAQAAVTASTGTLDINSPSRVGRDEVGKMYDAGIALGLWKNAGLIYTAARDVVSSMHDEFMVGDPSRGTVYSSGKTVRQAAKETAAQNSEDKSLLERARTMGIAIAEELINSGALEGDVIVDGEKAGRKVSGAVSRKINRDSKKTVTGRTGKAVLA